MREYPGIKQLFINKKCGHNDNQTSMKRGGIVMDIEKKEKDMLIRIHENQYTGGAYKRATWIDKVCLNKNDKDLLDALCQKGLAETGLGGTVAGDTYRACWLTRRGKEAIGET